MSLNLSKCLIGTVVILGFAQSVLAWNAEGHMVVAQIAYNHLSPAAKTKCDALIAVPLTPGGPGTSNFVTASCWADDYKSELGSGIWHYIDLPFSLDGTSTNSFVPAAFDVVQAINLSIATLQNPGASPSNQAVSLRYLIHFVGDIQQPLHDSEAFFASKPNGDAGGNGFYLTGTWSNLHYLWDAGGGFLSDYLPRPLSAASQTTLFSKVAAIEALYPYNQNIGIIPNPMDWASEGKHLAETVAYVGITLNTTPTSSYTNTVQIATAQRMALGGHRLADLLNTLYAIRLGPITHTNQAVAFSWNAVSGQVYRVQWKLRLTDPTWTDLTNIMATGSSASFSEPNGQIQRFYRIAQ